MVKKKASEGARPRLASGSCHGSFWRIINEIILKIAAWFEIFCNFAA